jgi:hypothetical protein
VTASAVCTVLTSQRRGYNFHKTGSIKRVRQTTVTFVMDENKLFSCRRLSHKLYIRWNTSLLKSSIPRHDGASCTTNGTNVTAQVQCTESWLCKLYIRWHKYNCSSLVHRVMTVQAIHPVDQMSLLKSSVLNHGSASYTSSGANITAQV